MIEIQRYLLEHPDEAEGVAMSQFSFQIPRPLQENYVKKRPAHSASLNGSASLRMPGDFKPSEVNPLAWIGPDENTDLQIGVPGYSATYKAPVFEPLNRPAKRSRIPSIQTYNGDYAYEHHQDEGKRA